MPTGIVVACQQERSQHKNRATAMADAAARLYEHELEKREAAANADAASKTDIGWGHQIRSYVLQPYQMVKDLRTGTRPPIPAPCSTAISMAFAGSLAARRDQATRTGSRNRASAQQLDGSRPTGQVARRIDSRVGAAGLQSANAGQLTGRLSPTRAMGVRY